jgi:uncharacterized membrane protein
VAQWKDTQRPSLCLLLVMSIVGGTVSSVRCAGVLALGTINVIFGNSSLFRYNQVKMMTPFSRVGPYSITKWFSF